MVISSTDISVGVVSEACCPTLTNREIHINNPVNAAMHKP